MPETQMTYRQSKNSMYPLLMLTQRCETERAFSASVTFRKTLATALGAALVLLSPGLGAYEALALTVMPAGARSSVRTSAGGASAGAASISGMRLGINAGGTSLGNALFSGLPGSPTLPTPLVGRPGVNPGATAAPSPHSPAIRGGVSLPRSSPDAALTPTRTLRVKDGRALGVSPADKRPMSSATKTPFLRSLYDLTHGLTGNSQRRSLDNSGANLNHFFAGISPSREKIPAIATGRRINAINGSDGRPQTRLAAITGDRRPGESAQPPPPGANPRKSIGRWLRWSTGPLLIGFLGVMRFYAAHVDSASDEYNFLFDLWLDGLIVSFIFSIAAHALTLRKYQNNTQLKWSEAAFSMAFTAFFVSISAGVAAWDMPDPPLGLGALAFIFIATYTALMAPRSLRDYLNKKYDAAAAARPPTRD